MLRIAFLTNEFVSEDNSRGGLANYLNRITQVLKRMGHVPEVFVVSSNLPQVIDYHGIRVERVKSWNPYYLRPVRSSLRRIFHGPWGGPYAYVRGAMALSQALHRRHAEMPFDFVQATDCGASGLFVGKLRGAQHLLRLSCDQKLWFEVDGRPRTYRTRLMWWLERKCRDRADTVYAPSQYLADHVRRTTHHEVAVVRPPMFVESEAREGPMTAHMPERFLLHFGQIGRRKGSDLVAKALLAAWKQEPELRMIWAGREILRGEFASYEHLWGELRSRVQWLGPVPKDQLYHILHRSIATVLPSRADNLPNTVLESLMAGVPVIGAKGASIDELVEHGRNGELVPIGDIEELASTMVRAWRSEGVWSGQSCPPPSILSEMEPERAADNLLRLAGYAPSGIAGNVVTILSEQDMDTQSCECRE